jgi:hypothetical protein
MFGTLQLGEELTLCGPRKQHYVAPRLFNSLGRILAMTESLEAPVPGLTALAAFAGEWTMELRWSEETHKLIGGPAFVRTPVRFEWIENGFFLVQRMGGNSAPDARWVIGVDDSSGSFSVLYADGRGRLRIYKMTLVDGVWKIWRDSPELYQRFLGKLSADQRTIEARWEKSVDGSSWEHDFDVTYTRAQTVGY